MLLVVENEVLIRALLASQLEDAGFGVTMASDGNQAILALDTVAARFRAVITDIRHQPGPDGWEVGRYARELAPDMVIVYVTENSDDAWVTKGVPGSILVSKPYEIAEITAALSALLTEAEANQAISSSGG